MTERMGRPADRRTGAAALALAAALLSPVRAAADINVFAKGSAGGGATNNVNGAPDDPEPGQPQKQEDVFVEGRVGGGVTAEYARSSHVLEGRFDARQSLIVGDAIFAGVGQYDGVFKLAEDSDLVVGAGAIWSSLRTFTIATPASAGSTSGILPPPQKQQVLGLSANEQYNVGLAEYWSFLQTTTAAMLYTLDARGVPPTTVDERLGPLLRLPKNEFRYELRGIYLVAPNPFTFETAHSLAAGPVVSWNHKLSKKWSTDLHGGIMFGFDLVEGSSTAAEPIAGGAINFRDDFGYASVFASRSVTPSLFGGQFFRVDEIGANGSLPYFDERLFLNGYAAVRSGVNVQDDAARTRQTFRALVTDAEILYLPIPEMTMSLRYEFQAQTTDDTGPNALPAFSRHLVQFSVGGILGTKPRRPPEEPADPSGRPPINRPANRPIW